MKVNMSELGHPKLLSLIQSIVKLELVFAMTSASPNTLYC